MKSILGLFAFGVVVLSGARAEEPLLQDFFLGRDARTQGRHELQLTWGHSLFNKHDAGGLAAVEYGINDRLQLELELPFAHQPGSNYGMLSRPAAGLSYQLLSHSDVLVSTGFETGPSGSEGWRTAPFVAVGRKIKESELHATLSRSLARKEAETEWALSWVGKKGRLRPVLEYLQQRSIETENVVLLGCMVKVSRSMETGGGVPVRLGREGGPGFAFRFVLEQ